MAGYNSNTSGGSGKNKITMRAVIAAGEAF
jgi:hypothetical protein